VLARSRKTAGLSRVPAVNGNGSRKPPRPRIELVAGNPSETEGAAIVAALEQFLAEEVPRAAELRSSRWQQAALREGVSREPAIARWGVGR
jgi:hypothetical protein